MAAPAFENPKRFCESFHVEVSDPPRAREYIQRPNPVIPVHLGVVLLGKVAHQSISSEVVSQRRRRDGEHLQPGLRATVRLDRCDCNQQRNVVESRVARRH